MKAFKNTVTTAWKLRNPVDVREILKNRCVFKFLNEVFEIGLEWGSLEFRSDGSGAEDFH